MNTIFILWLRQLKRHVRSRARMVGSLGQPLLFLLALGFGFGPIYQKAGGGDYFQFLVPGVITMGILFTAIFSGIEIIWDRQFGFLKETLVAPVPRFTIMLGRTLGGATVAALQGVVILIISLFFGFHLPSFSNLILAFVLMFLTALLFASLGSSIACLMDDMHGFQLIINFLVMPLFFLSGSLFPLQGLPKIMEWIAMANPLSYGVDGLRHTLIATTNFGLGPDFLILGSVSVLFLALGSYLFSKIQV